MGCDIPDIKVAVIYGVDSFVSFVQKGGRAGRDGKIEAKMVWLVEDWMFRDDDGPGGKRAQEKREKVDPMTREYIRRQREGLCLSKFMNQVLRPNPHALDLPGFGGPNPHGLDITWVVEGEEMDEDTDMDGDEEMDESEEKDEGDDKGEGEDEGEGNRPETGKCNCSAKSCCVPSADSDDDDLADSDAEELAAALRHRLMLNVFKPATSAAKGVLEASLGKGRIRCSAAERETFRTAIEQFRTDHWAAIRKTAPMLSRHWVIGEGNTKKLVENAHRIINTPKEMMDMEWIRELIDTVSDDATVDKLLGVIHEFHSGFFARRGCRDRPPGKQQKTSSSGSQRRPPSPATSTSTEDPDLDPDYSPSRHQNLGAKTPQGKRKRQGRSRAVGEVSIHLAQRPLRCDLNPTSPRQRSNPRNSRRFKEPECCPNQSLCSKHL